MNDLFSAGGPGKRGKSPAAPSNTDHSAKDIEVLEDLEPVRRRPGMSYRRHRRSRAAPLGGRNPRQRHGGGRGRPRQLHGCGAGAGDLADGARQRPASSHPSPSRMCSSRWCERLRRWRSHPARTSPSGKPRPIAMRLALRREGARRSQCVLRFSYRLRRHAADGDGQNGADVQSSHGVSRGARHALCGIVSRLQLVVVAHSTWGAQTHQ